MAMVVGVGEGKKVASRAVMGIRRRSASLLVNGGRKKKALDMND